MIVSFDPANTNGGPAVTQYRVTSTPNNIITYGTTSPILVTGLTSGTAYTFTIAATSSAGMSPESVPTNSVTLDPTMGANRYRRIFDFTGAPQSWIVPNGVTSLGVNVAGAQGGMGWTIYPGSAGGAGGIVTANLAVTPGQALGIYVGGKGGDGAPCTPCVGGIPGWNGGGGVPVQNNTLNGAGGGGSDIRVGGSGLQDCDVVAGGGGRGAAYAGRIGGGIGGGLVGGIGGAYHRRQPNLVRPGGDAVRRWDRRLPERHLTGFGESRTGGDRLCPIRRPRRRRLLRRRGRKQRYGWWRWEQLLRCGPVLGRPALPRRASRPWSGHHRLHSMTHHATAGDRAILLVRGRPSWRTRSRVSEYRGRRHSR